MQQEKKLIEYVCGFYFDHKFKRVVLIWKNKPNWQKGKLNGIGGKIEKEELPITAMRREFHEETGIMHNEWVDLITLTGEEWRVYFFCSIGKVNEFEYVETKEEEEVAKIEIERLLAWDFDHIPNLDWLIPMAMNKLQYPEEKMSFNAQHPAGCEWVKATDRLPGWGKYVKWRHESGKELPGQESIHSMTDRDHVSLHGWEWYDESPSKEGNKEREGEFAEWLYHNRWFYFENGKWHYTFEQGSAVSGRTYKKNYVKTTAQLYEQYLQQKG